MEPQSPNRLSMETKGTVGYQLFILWISDGGLAPLNAKDPKWLPRFGSGRALFEDNAGVS